MNPDDFPQIKLPPQSKCRHCGDDVTLAREISLVRHTWDLLKPLESSSDTISVERHLPTQFQLAPPKETGLLFNPGYGIGDGAGRHQSQDAESSSVSHHPMPLRLTSTDQSRTTSQALPSVNSTGYHPPLDTPATELSTSENVASLSAAERALLDPLTVVDSRGDSITAVGPPFSPDSIISHAFSHAKSQPMTSTVISESSHLVRSRALRVVAPPEKVKSNWRSKLGTRKDSLKASGDTSSLSSTTLEAQRFDEISLKSLATASKTTARGKSAKNINVSLSHNSTYALFWTQTSIHMWDVETSPPIMVRAIATESTCLLAALTKVHLAYMIGTRDQKLTVSSSICVALGLN